MNQEIDRNIESTKITKKTMVFNDRLWTPVKSKIQVSRAEFNSRFSLIRLRVDQRKPNCAHKGAVLL